MGQEAPRVQARYSPAPLKLLDEARFGQKTEALNHRVNAGYFRGLGKTQQEAARLANISPNTRRKFVAAFESGGLAAVVADARQGPPSALDEHVDVIRFQFGAQPAMSVAQAME